MRHAIPAKAEEYEEEGFSFHPELGIGRMDRLADSVTLLRIPTPKAA